ncbi:hypothetical protein P8452_68913 [Trifolium repens]|nr:hypothetical protein P8452_68913 [Trifolium repens]
MLPPKIILKHILPRLDGETLIALSLVSSEFFHLICENTDDHQWRNICISTCPSLLSNGPLWLSDMITNMVHGGSYRSFLFDAFSSIHHRNHLPQPPIINFSYAVDIFFEGEHEREPLYTNIEYQRISSHCMWCNSSVAIDVCFKFCASNMVDSNLNFIEVKKDGCEEYLKEKLRLSCVLISSRYCKISSRIRNRAWGLFSSSCKPIVYPTNNKRWVVAEYETVMPGLLDCYCDDCEMEMVKFKVKVKCGWKGGEEDRFYVKSIEFKMEDMNGKGLKEEYAARVLLNAVENGERKNK